jgi:hypothetical protein
MHQRITTLYLCSILFVRVDALPGKFHGILDFFEAIFPLFYAIAVFISYISLVVGGITFLLDSRDENGKEMIFRSLTVILIFFFIFKGLFMNYNKYRVEISNIEVLGSFVLLYSLFSLAALSLIMLIVNFGLYMINPSPKNKKGSQLLSFL